MAHQRGGRRAGRRGEQYPNRSDLRQPLTPQAPTGLPYGERKALIDAQRAIPLAPPGGPPQAPGGAASLPAPTVLPGSLGAFDRPSERPDEPVTAGLPVGAGPGREALGPLGPASAGRLSDLLAQVAMSSGSAELGFLAQKATEAGQ